VPCSHCSLPTFPSRYPVDLPEKDKRRSKSPKGPPYAVYGFPEIISTHAATRRKSVEIYTRALLLEGHGYPVFYPFGRLNPQNPSVLKPITIGDVGVVKTDGNFKWLFNIFLPADRPTQVALPNEFQPFAPAPSDSDVVFTPNYHKPGTVVASAGVEVNIRSKEPWSIIWLYVKAIVSLWLSFSVRDIKFTSGENQAGMLILQGGADRYDLMSSERYHEYIAKNAQHWYQVANNFVEATFPNGSLLVVTGYDSCNRFSHAQFAPESTQPTMDMTFIQELGKTPGRWWSQGNNQTVGWPYPPHSNAKAIDGPLTVFVRGIRVSLNGRIWRSILPSAGFLPKNLHCTLVASTPSKPQLWLEKIKVKLRIGQTEEEMLQEFLSLHEVGPIVNAMIVQLLNTLLLQSTFQPNYILGQILLGQVCVLVLWLSRNQMLILI
jgi:hypothetical protein